MSKPGPGEISRLASVLASYQPDGMPVVAVPMANNPEVIGAIGQAISRRLARFILIGPPDEMRRIAREHGTALDEATFVEENEPVAACTRAAGLAAAGEAQVLMKGLVQTAEFVRSILARERGLVGEGGLLSHVALCDVSGYERLFFLTDAGVTTYPDAQAKRRIVENVLSCTAALGYERPRVAMVAPVEKVSDKVPATGDAAAVVEAFRGDPRLVIGGPFGLDVAINPEAARIKGIESAVAGRADVLVLANIDAGNVLYKSLTGFAHARIAGIVAGASVPVVLTSRADSEESKLLSLRFAFAVAGGS